MVSNEDKAWLAGIIDGEGTITISDSRKWAFPQAKIQIPNTNLDLLEDAKRIICEILGRKISLHVSGKPAYRPCYQLKVHKRSSVKLVCEAVLPYLRAKKEQAQLVLTFIAITPNRGRSRTGVTRPDEMAHALMRRIKKLNRRYAKGEWENSLRETERPAPDRDEETIRSARRRAEAAETTARLLPFEKVIK